MPPSITMIFLIEHSAITQSRLITFQRNRKGAASKEAVQFNLSMEEETDHDHPPNPTTILFVYGTLKKAFPNYHILSAFLPSGDVSHLSPSTAVTTITPYPLVLGPIGVPFLLPLPSTPGSRRVSGELIAASPRALAALDDLEGLSLGHYERRPVRVKVDGGGEMDVEAYFAHRSYAEAMWRKSGEMGVEEYTAEMALEYVKPEDRAPGIGTLGEIIRAFLGS